MINLNEELNTFQDKTFNRVVPTGLHRRVCLRIKEYSLDSSLWVLVKEEDVLIQACFKLWRWKVYRYHTPLESLTAFLEFLDNITLEELDEAADFGGIGVSAYEKIMFLHEIEEVVSRQSHASY